MSQVFTRSGMLAVSISSLLISAACSEPAPPPPPAPTPVVKTAEQRVELYKACWDQFSNKQWDQFQNCYAENAITEAIDSNPPSITGRTAIIERAKLESAAFPDRRGELKIVLINGERVAGVALFSGTNTGPMPPGPDGKAVPATNQPVGMLIAHTIELDPTGAHAVREAAYFEENTLAGQLGLSPAPGRKAEKPSGAPAEVVIAKNDDKERGNIEVVRKSFAALNAHDVKGVGDTMAPNYKSMDIAQPKDMDKAASLKSLKEMLVGFPDVKITPVTMWAAGDYVVVTGTFEGTNLGDIPSMGMKKTGKKVSAHFFELFKIENNLCKDDWLFYNARAMYEQLVGAK